MADKLYPKWGQEIQQGNAAALLNGSGATGVYAALIDTANYTYSDADEFWDEGGAADPIDAIIGTAVEITGKTFVDGVFDGADVTIPSVSGATAEAIIIYVKNAGLETTHRLVYYLDNTTGTGLPITPDGNNINVTWNASGIFKLTN